MRFSLILALSLFPISLFAATEVKFADEDLRAVVQLARPELSTIRLQDRTGEFRPGPSLRFAGLEPRDFDVSLDIGGNLVDLRFNEVRGHTAGIALEAGRMRIDFQIADQEKAIRSRLGSISLKNLVVSTWLRFAADGSARLEYESAEIIGEMKGTGFLKPRWVMDAVRKEALKAVKSQIEHQLARDSVQDAVEKGLVMWARISRDDRLTRTARGSLKISTSAIRYSAE